MTTQVALAVMLVICAGLMTRSLLHVRSVKPGFDPDRTRAVTLQYNMAGAKGDIGDFRLARREQILRRLASLPDVVAAGSITSLPLEHGCGDILIFRRADGTGAQDGSSLRAPNCIVSPGYLQAMRLPLVAGKTAARAMGGRGAVSISCGHCGGSRAPPPVVYFNQRTAPRVVSTIVLGSGIGPTTLIGPGSLYTTSIPISPVVESRHSGT